MVRELDLPFFVVNPDTFDILLPADVLDNLCDIIPRVEHHRVIGTQHDRFTEPIRIVDDALGEGLPLVFNVEVGPGGDGYQEDGPDGKNQLGAEPEADLF